LKITGLLTHAKWRCGGWINLSEQWRPAINDKMVNEDAAKRPYPRAIVRMDQLDSLGRNGHHRPPYFQCILLLGRFGTADFRRRKKEVKFPYPLSFEIEA